MALAGREKALGYSVPCCEVRSDNGYQPRCCVFCSSRSGNVTELERIPRLQDLVSLSDCDGRNPLHWAACKGHLPVTRLLLHHGAKVNARDNSGETALTLAGRWSEKKQQCDVSDTVLVLVQYGANLNVQQSEGHTALHVCVAGGYEKAVTSLLAAGADCTVVNVYGEAPVCIALRKLVDNDKTVARGTNVAMARMLLQHGVAASQSKRLYVLLGSALAATAACPPWQEHSARDVVSLLNEHGYVLTEREHARQLLRARCCAQREGIIPLATLCRRVIRQSLERAIPAKCQSLPIPPSVQRYIVTGYHFQVPGSVVA